MSDAPQGTPPAPDSPTPTGAGEGADSLSFRNVDRPAKRKYRRRRLPLLSDPTRTIVVEIPRCKVCGSAKLRHLRTELRDGDAVVRRMECGCGEVWAVSFE